MEMERLVKWLNDRLFNLSLRDSIAYFLFVIACCTLTVITLNVILPEWIRWFDHDDFWYALIVLIFFSCICLVATMVSSSDTDEPKKRGWHYD